MLSYISCELSYRVYDYSYYINTTDQCTSSYINTRTKYDILKTLIIANVFELRMQTIKLEIRSLYTKAKDLGIFYVFNACYSLLTLSPPTYYYLIITITKVNPNKNVIFSETNQKVQANWPSYFKRTLLCTRCVSLQLISQSS